MNSLASIPHSSGMEICLLLVTILVASDISVSIKLFANPHSVRFRLISSASDLETTTFDKRLAVSKVTIDPIDMATNSSTRVNPLAFNAVN